MGRKRKNGEGSWGTKTINGIKYKYFRNSDGKYFYGKTEKEIKEKIEKSNQNSVSNKTPFGEYLLWYYNEIHRKKVEETTYASYMAVCKVIINNKYYNISDIQLGSFSIKNNYFTEFFEAITPHYSYNSIKNIRKVISSAIMYAEKHGDIEKGVYAECVFPNRNTVGIKERKINFLTKNIVDQMYEHIYDQYNTGNLKYGIYYWVILLIVHTGIRSEEARALTLKDVNFKDSTLTINKAYARLVGDGSTQYVMKNTKTYSSNRIVPLNSVATEMLHNIINYVRPKKPTDYLLYNNYIKLNNNALSTCTKRFLRNINSPIKQCSPHELRHTFGSILYEQGIGIKTISDLMGHSSISTTANIYVNLSKTHLQESVNVLQPEKRAEDDELNDNVV